MAENHYLAFDLGAESGRAVVGTLANDHLTLEVKHRFANTNGKMLGKWRWNLLAQWQELKTGLRLAGGDSSKPLTSLGVDTWGVDFGLIGADGDLIGDTIMYRDSRTQQEMPRVHEQIGRRRLFDRTGIQMVQINTIYQLAAMARAKSPALSVAQSLLFMPDLFNYLFTGVRRNEFSIASTSQMYDATAKTWAKDILEELSIPTHILGEIVPSGALIGPLQQDIVDECGISPIPVIAPCCHDTGSAVVAAPASGDNWCYISSGTWSLMGVELDAPVINDKTYQYDYTNEGGINGTTRLLKNIMGLWLVQECRRHWQKNGEDLDYATLTDLAAKAHPFAALIDPNDQPFFSPGDMPTKIEQYCIKTHQPVPSSKGAFVRACLESLALDYRKALDGLEDVLGRRQEVIHIIGGGAHNELLNQMTADACGRTVVAGPFEATSVGNILVQAMSMGQVKSLADARAISRSSFGVKQYEPRDTTTWQGAYERYRQMLGK